MWRPNKDKEGDFTDEAIEVVERELKELAEKIQVEEDELGTRIADETFRQSYDFIEEELIIMRTVAMDIVNERAKKLLTQVQFNKPIKKWLMIISYACASIGLYLLLRTMYQLFYLGNSLPMDRIVPALVFIVLFMMLVFASINAQAIDRWLLREINIDLDLSKEIAESARDLIQEARQTRE